MSIFDLARTCIYALYTNYTQITDRSGAVLRETAPSLRQYREGC